MELKDKRILLKVSGEAMGGADENGDKLLLDHEALLAMAKEIAALADNGVQVGVVVGGGNFWRARSAGDMERNRADHMGMLATAMNAIALQDKLLKLGRRCTVLSAVRMQRFCDEYSAREADRLLNSGEIVVFACGTGSPYFTTDTGAALRACEIHADALLLAKNIDAIYDKDPNKYPDAKRFEELTYDEAIALNQKAIDATAVQMCADQKLPMIAFAMKEPGSVMRVMRGENLGTIIH